LVRMHVHVADQHDPAATRLVFPHVGNQQRVGLHMPGLAVDLGLDETVRAAARKTQTARGGFMDFAQATLPRSHRREGPPDSLRASQDAGRRNRRQPSFPVPQAPPCAHRSLMNLRNSLEPSRKSRVSNTSRLSSPGSPHFAPRRSSSVSKTSFRNRRFWRSACPVLGVRQLRLDPSKRIRLRPGDREVSVTGEVMAQAPSGSTESRDKTALCLQRHRHVGFRPRFRHSARPSKQEIG
jgi:hypothetical protein